MDLTKRTMKSMGIHGRTYQRMIRELKNSKQDKYTERKKITHDHTFSMTGCPLADFLLKCVAPGSMHVMLGLIPWLIKCMRKAYKRIEELEAGAQQAGSLSPVLREQIEWVVEMSLEYEKYLREQLEGTISAVSGHEETLRVLVNHINYHEQMIRLSIQESERLVWMARLSELREMHIATLESMSAADEEEKEDEAQLLEQLYVTREMREEFEEILKKHEGHASRVIGAVMADNGVDEQIYHKGAVIGNHCITFAEEGESILSGIDGEMKNTIQNEKISNTWMFWLCPLVILLIH